MDDLMANWLALCEWMLTRLGLSNACIVPVNTVSSPPPPHTHKSCIYTQTHSQLTPTHPHTHKSCIYTHPHSQLTPTHTPHPHTSFIHSQAEWCAPFLLQLLRESPLSPLPTTTTNKRTGGQDHTDSDGAESVGTAAEDDTEAASSPQAPSSSSPSRRRFGRNPPSPAVVAVAVAVVPNSPQRQPRALRAGLPFRLRLQVTGPYTPTPTSSSSKAPAASLLPSAPGRPCVPAVLEQWAKAAKGVAGRQQRPGGGRERLGLVVCGPQGMTAEARRWAVGRRGGAVDVHEEVFHW